MTQRIGTIGKHLRKGIQNKLSSSNLKCAVSAGGIRSTWSYNTTPPQSTVTPIKPSFNSESMFTDNTNNVIPYTFRLPACYIQGDGVIQNIGKYVSSILSSKKVAVIIGPRTKALYENDVHQALTKYNVESIFLDFNGECSFEEADRLYNLCQTAGDIDCIIGIGGGKVIDVSKVVSEYLDNKIVSFPTIASNDGPVSALSIMYTPDHKMLDVYHRRKHPDLVMVDNEIILQSPVRYFISGMGDALATHYEAKMCYHNPSVGNFDGGKTTLSAYTLAELSQRILFEHGVEAVKAMKDKRMNDSFKKVIEANILLSGVGFQNGGLCTAHSFAQAIVNNKYVHDHYIHGEHVAVGTVIQLLLQNDYQEAVKVSKFCNEVGLPFCCKQIGYNVNVDDDDKELNQLLEDMLHLWTYTEPFKVNKENLLKALRDGDKLEKQMDQSC